MAGTLSDPNASRVALCVEYNGNRFNGWQAQKSEDVATVQENLEKALAEVADEPVKLTCAGRTDAGVHATAQVVHFDHFNPRPDKAWVRGGNSLLPPAIAIRWATQASHDFHARFSATARRYRYVICNDPVKPAILNGLVTSHYLPLDASAMHAAGQHLLGENDFSAFRGAACQSSTPMRNVTALEVRRRDAYVVIDITANAFLLHMVRNIAGVLMEIGQGAKPVDWAGEVLAKKDRTVAGVTAAPDGLYLVDVTYPEQWGLPERLKGPDFLIL